MASSIVISSDEEEDDDDAFLKEQVSFKRYQECDNGSPGRREGKEKEKEQEKENGGVWPGELIDLCGSPAASKSPAANNLAELNIASNSSVASASVKNNSNNSRQGKKKKKKKKRPTAEEALAELTVWLGPSLRTTSPFQMELRALLPEGCTFLTVGSTMGRQQPSVVAIDQEPQLANCVCWYRLADDDDDDDEENEDEDEEGDALLLCPYLLVLVPGQQFIQWAREDQLAMQFTMQKSAFSNHFNGNRRRNNTAKSEPAVMWLVDSVHSFLMAERQAVNQRMRQVVRSNFAPSRGGSASQTGAAAAVAAAPLLPAAVDYTFESAQLEFLGCQVLDVTSAKDAARVVAELTRAVAERPYKEAARVEFATFCPDSVRSTKNQGGLSAWGRQLMLVRGVSRDVAEAIVAAYPSLGALLRVYYDPSISAADKESWLHDRVQVHRAASGTSAAVTIPASRNIYKMLTAIDGNQLAPWLEDDNSKKKKKKK